MTVQSTTPKSKMADWTVPALAGGLSCITTLSMLSPDTVTPLLATGSALSLGAGLVAKGLLLNVPDQQAVITDNNFGRNKKLKTPGLHIIWPWESVKKTVPHKKLCFFGGETEVPVHGKYKATVEWRCKYTQNVLSITDPEKRKRLIVMLIEVDPTKIVQSKVSKAILQYLQGTDITRWYEMGQKQIWDTEIRQIAQEEVNWGGFTLGTLNIKRVIMPAELSRANIMGHISNEDLWKSNTQDVATGFREKGIPYGSHAVLDSIFHGGPARKRETLIIDGDDPLFSSTTNSWQNSASPIA